MYTPNVAHYRRTQIETATPLQLVVMLYDGAIDNVRLARTAIAEKDLAKKTQAVDKLLAILGELQSNLDMEQGGVIADNLNALYSYMCEQVVQASVQLDPGPLDQVLSLLETVGSAWREIASKPEVTMQQNQTPNQNHVSVRA